MTGGTRTEKDSLGTLEVPADAYYGIQTARAIRNFPISGRRRLGRAGGPGAGRSCMERDCTDAGMIEGMAGVAPH